MTSGCGRCFRVALGLQLFGGWWWWFLTSTAATAAEWPPRRHGRHDLWRSKRSLFVLRHRAGASSEDDTHDFVTDPTLNENEPEEHRAERIDAVNDELTPLLLREDAEKVDAEDDAPHNPFRSESFPEDGRNALPSFVGKTRHTSDVMVDLSTRSGVNGQILPPESLQLRALITQRTAEYWHEVRAAAATAAVTTEPADPDPPQQQQQQPSTRPDVRKKLLHYLAPKIPAIKHSPDVALPIRCARSDMDSGVAACLIGTLGHVVVVAQQTFHDDQSTMMNDGKCSRVAEKIVSDRRFEQLVECLLCGSVDVKERQKEWWEVQQQQQQGKKSGGHDATTTTTITAEMNDRTEAIFEKNEARLEEGLSIRDSCRAALGLALLVGVDQTTEEIGGEKVSDILTALALRTRDMLLLRFQKLKQSDLDENDDRWDLSIDERLVDFAEELAEDTATAMWTFARVREKFTSLPCYQPLLDVCCSILCADPWDLRRLAQEIEVTIDATIVGSNDIVDRLAFSEEIDEKAEKQTCPDDDFIRTSETSSMAPDKRDDAVLIDFDPAEPLITRKVSIMDWLSPNELTSTLWALASHGNEKNKPGLTEIENTFRDCAFERIIEWLRLELEYARAVEIEEDVKALHVEHRKEPVSPLSTRVHENQANDCNPNIPVVNSVTLESGDIEVGVGFSTATADNRTIIMADDGVSHVRIVDASALLAHESVHDDDDWVDDAYVEDLVMSTAIESPLFNSIAEIIRPKKYFQLFSASDLCSIAWTVTELNATLREPVMAAVMKLFVYAGPESLQGLYGGNLSNLAWAVAKNANNNDQALRSHALDVLLTGWIADLVLRTAREKSLTDDLFQRFHPAQLSRLFCAIATVHSTRVDGTRMTGTGLRELGSVGLMTAASNLDLFSTEDLARILWAYLVLSDHATCGRQRSSFLEALVMGKILTKMETSLLQWENVQLPFQQEDFTMKRTTRFSSFFRRARLHVPFLDRSVDELTEDENEQALPTLAERSRLPLLRDLPLDPLTLCKVACSVERLTEYHDGERLSGTLTRIALRLLTSRSGRLMRECPIQDLVRLCEAAVRTDLQPVREMISLFCRRVVHHLNRLGQEDLSILGVGDCVTLVWALGELGVKYAPVEKDSLSPHRRLRLVTKLPFINKEQLVILSNPRVIKLLRGIVTMQVTAIDKHYVLGFLIFMQKRAALISEGSELCDAMQSIGMLRMSSDSALADINLSSIATDVNQTSPTADDDTPTLRVLDKKLVADVQIRDTCDSVLSMLTQRISAMVPNLQAKNLRKVLMALSSLPLKNDDLIAVIEREVVARQALLEATKEETAIAELLERAAASASAINRIVAGYHYGVTSSLVAWKIRMKSLFGSRGAPSHHSEQNDEASQTLTDDIMFEELQREIKEAIQCITAATTKIDKLNKACHVSIDEYIDTVEHDVLVELGRCIELIDRSQQQS